MVTSNVGNSDIVQTGNEGVTESIISAKCDELDVNTIILVLLGNVTSFFYVYFCNKGLVNNFVTM